MGRHGMGERNENGERFANLCAFNKSVIGGTIFPCKLIHKATWISPDHTTDKKMDHILINKKFRRTMEDVRTKRGTDVASDHHLVVANLKLKLKKNWTTGQTALQGFNTDFLRDTNKFNEYKIALNNRFQALQDLLNEEETTMEDNWKGIKEALTSTCQEVLGLKKHHHDEWISMETLHKIQERKNKKTTINNKTNKCEEEHKSRQVEIRRKSTRRRKYKTATNKRVGKYGKPVRPVKDKEGKTITEVQEQRNRWVEYFKEILNRPATLNPPDIETTHTEYHINVTPPTVEEIRMAIRQINSEKAAGPDNISAEVRHGNNCKYASHSIQED
ncbi:unnamed protein product [Schistosoma curassoni]|uniref:Endo/exonuclease/phosphatase domain-containing protein n=1 Tax=Schistosoma curassoni TaxID=6186 RepID=A0A183K505_9TREM|nr:unnamed protein product [Schistosoma curassoni]